MEFEFTPEKTYQESVQWAKDFAFKHHGDDVVMMLYCRISCLEGLLRTTMYYLANAEEVAGKK
jgi:hypothetical protein